MRIYQNNPTPKLICRMDGFSGAKVELLEDGTGKKFVRKTGNISRNLFQLNLLKIQGYQVPEVLGATNDVLDMEYIQGIDIKTYLVRNDTGKLVTFLIKTLESFKRTSIPKDWSSTYKKNLDHFRGDSALPFTPEELLARLPKIIPCSLNHGDFTLENLLYSENSGFTLIDVSSGDYSSYIFDIAKMRQDLDCGWFLRGGGYNLAPQLYIIRQALQNVFPEAFDDALYILMLLRVYKYCGRGTTECTMLLNEIKKIWK